METTILNATEYRNVSLSLLNESKTNPRRIFEDAALKELADSIRSQGVLSPLLVRPLTEKSFEIVAGARRFRAAQIAEVPTVPVRIVNLSDAEALEAQLIELSIVGKSFLLFMRPSTLFICKRRTGPAIGALDLGASRGRVNLPRTLFWGMFILTIGVVGHREEITDYSSGHGVMSHSICKTRRGIATSCSLRRPR